MGMWEVREQGQNMGWGLRAEPQAKGKLLRLETKAMVFFLLRIRFKKLN